MAMAISALVQANALIEKKFSSKPLCYNQQSNPQFEIVNNVFHRFYIGEIQPLLAKLHQQSQELFGLIDQLQASSVPNQNFIEFWDKVYKSKNSEWQRFNAVIATHTKAWQKLLQQCGRLPG